MASVRLLSRAERDFESAAEWYDSRSGPSARRFEDAVAGAQATLARLPQLYAPDQTGQRVCPVAGFPYLLVYRYDAAANEVVVSAVEHARQGP